MNDDFKNYIQLLIDNKDKIIHLPERDIHNLLDYITNLQQENERLETNLGELQNAIDNIAELIGIPESMCVEDVYDKVKDYKSRIEKAVEYGNSCINKNLDLETLDEPYKTTFKTAYEIHNNYLDILNGRSDE